MTEQYLSDFDFDLPEELIAQFPLEDRTSSRLLHVNGLELEDLHFRDLPSLLRPDDLLVFNNTKVIKARLNGRKESGGVIEAMLERITGVHTAISMLRASKSPKPGTRLLFDHPTEEKKAWATVGGRQGEFYELTFDEPVLDVLDDFGKVPLPPYITHIASKSDEKRYQTVYAKDPGAVAAPTAGLHFTDALLKEIRDKGCEEVFVTLHVGAGTFQPVRVEKLSEHQMHSEWYSIDSEVADKINSAKKAGRRVICVGTTSLRAVESASVETGMIQSGQRETRLFITPGYRFNVCDAMVTNFHLPKSTLLMLISALCGREEIKHAYEHAIQEKYRFFSYGDACFLERK
ncbi:MAG: tRNA preQ1(34) S-adenosylmethionine ribosyltransferase-isomerase QueA [Burkholderiaceae bacterium]|nr:tRNA preQ1(34) S-adenosylmethionine ribosyltransferase-isomerase QueA [Burkholderiaceae bacterium]